MSAFKFRLVSKLDAAVDGSGSELPKSVCHYWDKFVGDIRIIHGQRFNPKNDYVALVAGYIIFLAIKHGSIDINDLTDYGTGLWFEYTQNSVLDDSGFEEMFYSAA